MLQARPAAPPARRPRPGLPAVSASITPRARLGTRLGEATATSRLALVTAASGAGKTVLVSSWAETLAPRTSLCWQRVGSIENLMALSPPRQDEQPTIVVLDDFPLAPTELINSELHRLLTSSPTTVRFVLLATGSLVLDLHLLGADAETVPLTSADLGMDLDEIDDVLTRHGLGVPEDDARAIRDHTAGWARGVRLAALFLRRSGSMPAALAETDRAIARYLDAAVLSGLARPALELLTATSVVSDVTYGVAQAVVGPAVRRRLATLGDCRGFVEVHSDGSLRCHPLLRRLLLRRLGQDPSRARTASRRAAEWFADNGDEATAVDLAVEAGDWAWAGRRLVESLAVPRLLLADPDRTLSRPEVAEAFGRTEPLLLATAALGQSWRDVAEVAVERAAGAVEHGGTSVAEALSLAVLRLATARLRADVPAGLEQARRATTLCSQLGLAQRAGAPELIPLIQSHLGLFELWSNAPDRARATFERGARAFRPRPAPEISGATQVAAADCLGQLAWLEAVGGELTRAERHASEVLTARPADSTENGVLHAQLATIWSHIARGELEQAGQRFNALTTRHAGIVDGETSPGASAAADLTAAHLALVVGDGRLGRATIRLGRSPTAIGWFDDQLRLARVLAELNAGQPAPALALLREADRCGAETQLLRARAWIELGDLAAVGASLRVRPVEALTISMQIQIELVEAWLAQAHGDRHRQRALIDRALRTAGREQLRTPIAWAKPWLHSAVCADPELLRRHGVFLASIRSVGLPGGENDRDGPSAPAPLTEALTDRELDILQRLGTLSTNSEIAADLFLSANTVKTHLKSLFRKLAVTRRSEAFRRGRALGLC